MATRCLGECWTHSDPVLGQNGMEKNGEGWVPIFDRDGTQLLDEDGNSIYEETGWHVVHDEHGMVLWDNDGQLCVEEVDDGYTDKVDAQASANHCCTSRQLG